jgi:hypothetical protein
MICENVVSFVMKKWSMARENVVSSRQFLASACAGLWSVTFRPGRQQREGNVFLVLWVDISWPSKIFNLRFPSKGMSFGEGGLLHLLMKRKKALLDWLHLIFRFHCFRRVKWSPRAPSEARTWIVRAAILN